MKGTVSKPIAAIALGAVVAVGIGAFVAGQDSSPVSGPGMDKRLLEVGKAAYAGHCASCHGANLEGEPGWRERGPDGYLPAPPHDSTGHTWHHPDQQLFAITKYGTAAFAPAGYKTAMIGFEDRLSDFEIRAVLAYIKSFWGERERAFQAAATERAARPR